MLERLSVAYGHSQFDGCETVGSELDGIHVALAYCGIRDVKIANESAASIARVGANVNHVIWAGERKEDEYLRDILHFIEIVDHRLGDGD